ncbi:hypothetical protein PF002_g33193, partial [Phytophthora fragariae]
MGITCTGIIMVALQAAAGLSLNALPINISVRSWHARRWNSRCSKFERSENGGDSPTMMTTHSIAGPLSAVELVVNSGFVAEADGKACLNHQTSVYGIIQNNGGACQRVLLTCVGEGHFNLKVAPRICTDSIHLDSKRPAGCTR